MTTPKKYDEDIYRDSAWKYFSIHADQRLRMFQFFITISTALLGGGLFILKSGNDQEFLIFLGLFSSFVAFIFWKLDIRTRNLIKNSEEAIKFLDSIHEIPDVNGSPNPIRMFTRDDYLVENKLYASQMLGHFSYRRCFEWVFAVVGMLGLIATTAGTFNIIDDVMCR